LKVKVLTYLLTSTVAVRFGVSVRKTVDGTSILNRGQFLARDVIYTSRAYAMMPVRLSVTEVHWRIDRRAAAAAVLLAGESSRAMLASARLYCLIVLSAFGAKAVPVASTCVQGY